MANELRLGNLEACRDWGYAGDYVTAMWLMLQNEQPEDFVICTGEIHSVRDLCESAFSYLGLDYHEYVVQDDQYFRPVEEKLLVGDPTEAQTKLGWKPTVGFEELIQMMVNNDLRGLREQI